MSSGDRVGAYTLAQPCGHWGGGCFAARDDASKRFVLQRAFGRQAPALAVEAAWRRAHPHANMPAHADDSLETNANANAWIAYAAIAAVRADHAMGVHPVPVVLSWATELIAVMIHHARCSSQSASETAKKHVAALRPTFSDLLFTNSGALLVLTVPSLARGWQSDGLRTSRFDASMWAPEIGSAANHELLLRAPARIDVFAVGGFLREMLQERTNEPRRDISARTALLVQRAIGPLEGRHESLDELAHDVRTSLNEFPPLDPADRERAVRAIAGNEMANTEKELRE